SGSRFFVCPRAAHGASRRAASHPPPGRARGFFFALNLLQPKESTNDELDAPATEDGAGPIVRSRAAASSGGRAEPPERRPRRARADRRSGHEALQRRPEEATSDRDRRRLAPPGAWRDDRDPG